MDSGPTAVIPAWVCPDHGRIAELHHLVYQLDEVTGRVDIRGVLAAIEWMTSGAPAPVTGRDDPVSWEQARAESWVALCAAAEAPAPTASDWARLGVYPQRATVGDSEHAYGAWRTLAWLLGARPDPPVEPPERDADGHRIDGPRYAVRPDLSSPVWRASEARRLHHAREDAQAHWRHIRQLVNASAAG